MDRPAIILDVWGGTCGQELVARAIFDRPGRALFRRAAAELAAGFAVGLRPVGADGGLPYGPADEFDSRARGKR